MGKRVLIVDDEEGWQENFRKWIREQGDAEIVSAHSAEEFNRLWTVDRNFDLIIMDSCLNSEYVDTIELVLTIRRSFGNPILAVSNSSPYVAFMMTAGCDFGSRKSCAHQKLDEILAK